jgi:hypothetical protein
MNEQRKAAFDYINNYQKEKYDRITILRKKGEKERISGIAKERGYRSLNEFVNHCIDKELERDG